MAEPWTYKRLLLPDQPSSSHLAAVIPDYQTMLFSVIAEVVRRSGADAAYPFINTKLDLIYLQRRSPTVAEWTVALRPASSPSTKSMSIRSKGSVQIRTGAPRGHI